MPNLKSNWYKIIIAIALIIAISVCTYRACNREQPVSTSSATGKVTPKQIPITYKGKSGTVHTEVKVVQAEHDVWLEDYYQHLLKEARDSLKLKEAELKEVLAASISTSGSLKIPISVDTLKVHDTIYPAKVFKYTDRFIKLVGRIDQDTVDLGYKSFDSLTFITYTKRKHLFAKKELYLNAFSMNPNATIKGLQSVKINAPPPKWAIGINAGYYFDGSTFRPGIGIGITKTIFRF